jgi:hypothetical protein
LSRPQLSHSCQLRCCVASPARQCRKPRQALPPRFPASRSRRRARWRGHLTSRCSRRTLVQVAGQHEPLGPPLKQPLGRRRLCRVRSWRGSPSSREPAAVAPMVAYQVSSTATNPGMAAPFRGLNLVSRQHAETYATTKPIMNARTLLSFWVGETVTPGGIAAACSQGGSWPGRSSSKCGRCAIDPKAIRTSAIAVEV